MMFKPQIMFFFSYCNYFVDLLHLKYIGAITNLSVLLTCNFII